MSEHRKLLAGQQREGSAVPSPAVQTFVQLMPVFRYRSLPAEFDP